MTFTISSELRSLIPPMAPEEFDQLESNIRNDGCHDPFIVRRLTGCAPPLWACGKTPRGGGTITRSSRNRQWEQSGTVAFDASLVGWQTHCTACGIPVPHAQIRGETLRLAVGLEVHVSACERCARRWEEQKAVLVHRLEARYGCRKAQDPEKQPCPHANGLASPEL